MFRPGIAPLDIHATISALTFFNVSKQHTFGLIFKHDLTDPTIVAKLRTSIVKTMLRYLCVCRTANRLQCLLGPKKLRPFA